MEFIKKPWAIIAALTLLITAVTILLPSTEARTPFGPAVDARFKKLENEYVARFVYDINSTNGATGDNGLGVYLPAKALITRSFIRIDEKLTESASGNVSIGCEDAENILPEQNLVADKVAGLLIVGASDGSFGGYVQSIASRCEITATVANSAQTGGQLTGWVKYVIHE